MRVDYIVVGLGLAGISFCERLEAKGKSFVVFSDTSERASHVAGGLYNPTILKRFTLAWKADVQLPLALPFYARLEKKLNCKLDYSVPVFRRFASVEEQNLWFEAADRPDLKSFLAPSIIANTNSNIDAPYGFGEVNGTGRVDTALLVKTYSHYLSKTQRLIQQSFDHESLEINAMELSYQNLKAERIVFAEGFGLKKNPFFNYLPLNGTKGELLTIKAPLLREQKVIKSSVFIIPLGDDTYRIGATYKWKDKTSIPTNLAKEELLKKLRTFLNCDFKVVEHVAGVRPTVADRRPLVGRHPRFKNLYVLNGFGSRGVLIAPYASLQLYDFIVHGDPLDAEMDIKRYYSKYA